jgi:hypothetical protein
MYIWLEDGFHWRYQTSGVMDQVAWSQASSTCQDNPFKENPGTLAPIGKRSEMIDNSFFDVPEGQFKVYIKRHNQADANPIDNVSALPSDEPPPSGAN